MSHCAKIVFLQNIGDVKNEVFEKKIAFFVFPFYVGVIETEKRKKKIKWKRQKKPYKISIFKVVIQKCENSKNMEFLQKLPDTICVRKGEETRIFVHTICFDQRIFWPKTVQTRKHYKNSGFSGNCPQKWHLFLENGVFEMGEKVGFTNKNRKLMKNSGLFLNMAKGCFFACFFFQALMSLCYFVW